MDSDLDQRLKELEEKINRISAFFDQARAWAKWTLIITIALVVIPLVGLMFALPSFLKTLNLNTIAP